jgi:hypothetical protein
MSTATEADGAGATRPSVPGEGLQRSASESNAAAPGDASYDVAGMARLPGLARSSPYTAETGHRRTSSAGLQATTNPGSTPDRAPVSKALPIGSGCRGR